MTRTLRISLLGDVVIRLGDDFVAGLPARAAEALLVYLVCSPRPVAREKLAELLWAERTTNQALTNLRTILTPLRRELGEYLVVTRQTLAFDHSRQHWLDVAEFEQGCAALNLAGHAPLDAARARQLQSLLDLYHGDFLEGFYLKDGHGFEEWATLRRERLRQLARAGFRSLAHFQLQAGAYLDGVATAARWRRLDPYSEEACRTHMWLLTRSGQPHLAWLAYQELEQALRLDVGVAPSATTAALVKRLRAVDFPPPVDLPSPATPFVGREAEIEALADLLVARDSRLLTLAGPGGIGKTRLAIEAAAAAARRLPGRFLDGVHFVPLAAVKAASSLPTHLADALHLALHGTETPRLQLLSHLERRELLLILDNFEHLIDDQGEAITLVIDLLRRAPGVKLLLTSRERLSLHEELVFDVTGLPAPEEAGGAPGSSSAVRLFVETARRIQRSFAPDEAGLACIADACRLVEGVPLAIELAAGWLRHYDCPEIVRRIRRSLDFLASDYRDLPERQRSLRSVFEYSWRLLAPDEQAALAQLAIFSGGFTADAAQAVAGRMAPLADLADKSLVQRAAGGRFDLHPLLRVYAAEKLDQDPAAMARAAGNHAAYYFAYLRSHSPGDLAEQRAAIRQELANIRCAWEWSALHGLWDALVDAAATLHSFYSVQSWFQEGIDLFARTLAALDAAGRAGVAPVALRAELLGRKARMHIHIGDLVQARAELQDALAGVGQIEDTDRRRSVTEALAITHYYAGDYGPAAALARDSLRLSQQVASQEGISFALNFLGSCAKAQGDYQQAQAYFQQAAEKALVLQDEIAAAMVFNNLGNLLQLTGDWVGALRYYQQSGELFKAHDHVHGAATTLANAGRLACLQGSYDTAQALLAESLALKRKIGDTRGEAVALGGLADVALATGALAEARAHLLYALALAQQTGDVKLMLELFVAFADLCAKTAQHAAALRLLDYTLNHRGTAQEAREQAARLAEALGHDWQQATGEAAGGQFATEAAMLDFVRSLD